MAGKHDLELAERRANAYVEFLMASYGVDLHGLADIAGIPRQTLTKFYKAPAPEKGFETLMTLARMSGINLSWLFGEELDGGAV